MNAATKTVATKTTAVTALIVTVTLVLLVGAVMLGWPLRAGMIGYGAMGNDVWMLIPTILWVWIPNLVMVGLGVLLAWVTFNKHRNRIRNKTEK